jgi:hypothetical protein
MRRPSLPRLAALAAALLVVACGGKKSPPTPPLTWTWVPIAGSMCNDGSPTGIAIEASAKPGADVIVFLDGGGACWDYLTCWQLHTASTGPFGQAQFDARKTQLAGTIFDRSAPGNPYKDFTFVFVPYCTGDVHSGDTIQTYIPSTQEWHHKGRVNVANAFDYLDAHLDAPAKVVVSGASAGGFGSLLAFTKAKATWPLGMLRLGASPSQAPPWQLRTNGFSRATRFCSRLEMKEVKAKDSRLTISVCQSVSQAPSRMPKVAKESSTGAAIMPYMSTSPTSCATSRAPRECRRRASRTDSSKPLVDFHLGSGSPCAVST